MIDSSPNQVASLFSEALSAISSSKWDIAENACKRILALHPDQLDATYMLGLIYQNIGNNELAITFYEKVLSLSNCHTDALNNLGTDLRSYKRHPKSTGLLQACSAMQSFGLSG